MAVIFLPTREEGYSVETQKRDGSLDEQKQTEEEEKKGSLQQGDDKKNKPEPGVDIAGYVAHQFPEDAYC